MKLYFFVLCICATLPAVSQKKVWKTGVNSFFENKEFIGSHIQNSQTMAGVHFAPEIGMSWNERHRIFAGADVMHEFGSNRTVDYYDPVIYYEFEGNPFRFSMGAIPRKYLLNKYPRMFFQDSVANYRPTITGLFWEYRRQENYLNVWLDWTSRQTRERHEAFFMGWSGRFNYGVLYGQHFGYMFHFAGLLEPLVPEGLHDNGLVLTQFGVNFAPKTGFEKLEANIGWSAGLERDRTYKNGHALHGLLSELKIEYRGLGLFNTFYCGARQQIFYGSHGSELYWGDPVYRAQQYDRADIYINFFKTDVVNIRFSYSLHFTEGDMFETQSLYASFNLDNLTRKKQTPYRYLWDNWFNNY